GEKIGRWLQSPESAPSSYALQRELFAPETRAELMRTTPGSPLPPPPHPEMDEVNAVSYLELTQYMRNVLLRDADVMSMAHSLEVRVPFLDHELVELVAGLPGGYK